MYHNSTDSEVITTYLFRFKDFLNDAWPALNAILAEHDWDNDPYILEDWLDDNWKHLFVRQILGKDYDFQPLSADTIAVTKRKYQHWLQVDKPYQGIFLSLGTNNNGFSISPPFDQIKVLTLNNEVNIVPLSNVKFSLIEKTEAFQKSS